ncbi:MAG TPA: NAD-dependent epimerase/dehydratase family protein [bacterium]|nr:NAD-dependent epimerase/dehydratase family protein [bacterium]
MGKKIAITGAAGYIGRMLVERLTAKKDVEKIVAVDVVRPVGLPSGVETAEVDVRDPAIVRSFKGMDTVVHLAFIVAAIHDIPKTYDINVNGSRNVLAACEKAGVEKLVAASSVAAYGRQPRDNRLINEDTPLTGDNASYYLHTKRLLEEALDEFEKRNPGVVVTRLRPSILIGPRNNNFAHELGRLLVVPHIREGAYLPVVHEEDVIDAFELALDRDVPGAFIISLPEPIAIEGFAARDRPRVSVGIETLKKLSRIGYALHLTLLSPDWIVAAEGNWRFDLNRSREVLGWTPKHDLETTVREMLENVQRRPLWKRMLGKA